MKFLAKTYPSLIVALCVLAAYVIGVRNERAFPGESGFNIRPGEERFLLAYIVALFMALGMVHLAAARERWRIRRNLRSREREILG